MELWYLDATVCYRHLHILLTSSHHLFPVVSASEVEAGVNHPDTYAQYVFRSNGVVWSLAMKDKGGLGKSFIFLRARLED